MGMDGEAPRRLTDFKNANGLAVFGLADRPAAVVRGFLMGSPVFSKWGWAEGTDR